MYGVARLDRQPHGAPARRHHRPELGGGVAHGLEPVRRQEPEGGVAVDHRVRLHRQPFEGHDVLHEDRRPPAAPQQSPRREARSARLDPEPLGLLRRGPGHGLRLWVHGGGVAALLDQLGEWHQPIEPHSSAKHPLVHASAVPPPPRDQPVGLQALKRAAQGRSAHPEGLGELGLREAGRPQSARHEWPRGAPRACAWSVTAVRTW